MAFYRFFTSLVFEYSNKEMRMQSAKLPGLSSPRTPPRIGKPDGGSTQCHTVSVAVSESLHQVAYSFCTSRAENWASAAQSQTCTLQDLLGLSYLDCVTRRHKQLWREPEQSLWQVACSQFIAGTFLAKGNRPDVGLSSRDTTKSSCASAGRPLGSTK